jgi:hypothetical protein
MDSMFASVSARVTNTQQLQVDMNHQEIILWENAREIGRKDQELTSKVFRIILYEKIQHHLFYIDQLL